MSSSPARLLTLSCATVVLASVLAGGAAVAAPATSPAAGEDPGSSASARPSNPRNGSGGRQGRATNPIMAPPSIPTPPAPVAPGSPVAPRNPIAPGNGGGNGPGAGRGRPSGGSGPAGGTRTAGGTTTAPTVGALPRNLRTSGLRAGRGPASISYFIDLGDLTSASAHLTVVPGVLAGLSAGSLGTITLRPLMTGRDANSTEAACALVAASQQNRAWVVASALAAARTTTDGDWLGASTLRSIGRQSGVSVARFVKTATGRSCYRQLTSIRGEARRAGIGSSPAYVVKGATGTRVVLSPASADDVLAAVTAVS